VAFAILVILGLAPGADARKKFAQHRSAKSLPMYIGIGTQHEFAAISSPQRTRAGAIERCLAIAREGGVHSRP
jgi:hypothetical protein